MEKVRMATSTNTIPETGPTSRLMTFEEMARAIKAKFDGNAHWLVAFDQQSKIAIDRVARRFYGDTNDGAEFSVFCLLLGGWTIGVAAMSKARMPARKLKKEMRRLGVNLGVDLAERDVLILTTPRNLDAATILLHQMLSYDLPAGFPTCPMSGIPTTDSRIDLAMTA
jgi:hypothetical protein